MKKKVVILGASGSIGQNAVRVLEALRGEFEVVGMVARNNAARLAEQAARLDCRELVIADESRLGELRRLAPSGARCQCGVGAIVELVTRGEVDTVLCAIVGTGGLLPVLAALRAGKRIALASKEVMVMAGELVNRELAAGHGRIVPVDSEHSAIFQCLDGRNPAEVRRVILTASGGAFRDCDDETLNRATYRDALAHPVWSMGPKVTVDSATLMNKALEILEAGALFRLPAERIGVVIHPQSVVHSMVEMIDGSLLAQLSVPDMRFAIQYALTYPARADGKLPELDWETLRTLEFRPPDRKRFPSLDFAYAALGAGGTMPAVLNAANEIGVERFSRGLIGLPDIWRGIERTMSCHRASAQENLETVLAADEWARRKTGEILDGLSR